MYLVDYDRAGPGAFSPGQSFFDAFTAKMTMRGMIPRPDKAFNHTHVNETDRGAVDIAGDHGNAAAMFTNIKISRAVTKAVSIHIFRFIN